MAVVRMLPSSEALVVGAVPAPIDQVCPAYVSALRMHLLVQVRGRPLRCTFQSRLALRRRRPAKVDSRRRRQRRSKPAARQDQLCFVEQPPPP